MIYQQFFLKQGLTERPIKKYLVQFKGNCKHSQLQLQGGIQFYQFPIMEDTHLFKFIHKNKNQSQNSGIKTFPHHTFGVSKQSPEHFQQKHTLINHNGYHYQHQHAPEFQYHSQKKSHVLAHHHNQEIHPNPHTHAQTNPYRFHLKKGRLTQFLDKNGWMNKVCLLSGHQRSQKARSLNNRDRDEKIKTLKERIEYENTMIKKPKVNQSYYNTLQDIMSEKVRIRSRRNSEAQRQIPLTQRTISDMKIGELQNENIRAKMAKTANEWYPSLRNDSSTRKRQLSFRQTKVTVSVLDDEFQTNGKDLDNWQRKTCNSKWCYKRERINRSEENQEHKDQIEK